MKTNNTEKMMVDLKAKLIKTLVVAILYIVLFIVSVKCIGWKIPLIVYAFAVLHNMDKHWPFNSQE